ncbi:dimeric dihydrodiol dehydrogenase [Aaosphaeria arxii CBS 175.79]|uniref:D-xylose 1-dehydrogenase (NADP(+), D-xylono-1,5-lactone-forming) n=1 Tax=Aaosphaeria arxii CBS 175.79 TaxID=1450172 RepID=A0A6A5XJU6_9PLEO|nr:dimeric dihydrodiol dehydrogenase [Aaosphaeria arxii CBS 175.79]KAF2013010.1 dimeric dihydrodiol dehydrogenase [Aaosphaeria arxii CBS 175.79]
MKDPLKIRWGILATGGIASAFAKDLSIDPRTRGVEDIEHELIAVASSTSKTKATAFLQSCDAPSRAKAYGNYADLLEDPEVDIVYIATPHSHHYRNAMQCLRAGKNVLCEKAFTVNALQAQILVKEARSRDLLLMEGMWTRYFPLSGYVRENISRGRIGDVDRVIAEHSLSYAGLFSDDKHIMINPDLAGGILLDGGIYSLTWVFQALWRKDSHHPKQQPIVKSEMAKYGPTGVDGMTTVLLEFPRASPFGNAHAVAATSLGLSNDAVAIANDVAVPCIRIQGQLGEIQIFPPAYRPTRTRIVLKDGTVEDKNWPQPGPGVGSGWFNGYGGVHSEGEGHGLFWEADDAGRALKEGRKEGSQLGLDESVLIMEIMDEIRAAAGLRYPDAVETTDL